MIKTKAWIVVTGENLPFEEVTTVLGVVPTRRRRRGEFPRPEFGRDEWVFEVVEMRPTPSIDHNPLDGFPDYPDVMTSLDQIRTSIGNRAERFAAWRSSRPLEVGIGLSIHSEDDDMPLMTLSADFIRFIATLGADLSIDVYANEGETFWPPIRAEGTKQSVD